MDRRFWLWCSLLIALFANPAIGYGHPDHGHAGGFTVGWLHPVTGTDHLVAMVAVGLWGVMLGGRAVWMLPSVFVGAMLLGGVLAGLGLGLPLVEPLILASLFVLGGGLLLAWRPTLLLASVVVGGFAIFHGYAHVVEAPAEGGFWGYALGFVLATILLHLAGVGAGLGLQQVRVAPLLRWSGAVVMLAGGWILLG